MILSRKHKNTIPRILFILKHRDNTFDCDRLHQYSCGGLGSGLLISTEFVANMLTEKLGVIAKVEQIIDNNKIDAVVTKFKPDICIIEDYWVIPIKFEILHKRHPNVLWVIHNHSALPFIAQEGSVLDWTLDYIDCPNVIIGCNDLRTVYDFRDLIQAYKFGWSSKKVEKHCVYLPNYYPQIFSPKISTHSDIKLSIGCFGAIRPLKNLLTQAVAAIQFASAINKKLEFHINGTRKEVGGEPILKNIRALFSHITQYKLIEHPWLLHDDFIKLVRKMDLTLQCSFSETFNIVTADAVMNDVPVVVSSEIGWVDPRVFANPTDAHSMVEAMREAMKLQHHSDHSNVQRLFEYNGISKKTWAGFIKNNTISR